MFRFKYIRVLFIVFSLPLLSLVSPDDSFRDQFFSDLNSFEKETEKLVIVSKSFSANKISVDSLRSQLALTRLSFKKVEFLVEYYYPSFIEEHINGAPLLHIEKYSTLPFVIPPKGLQVLDELIFSDSVKLEKDEIVIQSGILTTRVSELISGFENKKISDSDILQACKQELVRVFTLGVSGFDTPGSLNALPESKASMTAIYNALKSLPENKDSLNTNFIGAIKYLDSSYSFNEFDRAYFMRKFINPIYKSVNELVIEGKGIGTIKLTAVNPKSKSIFSANFLNPYYYTILTEEEDNDDVRALGAKLFYDPLLSSSKTLSCSSCHEPVKGFTDGVAKSIVGKDGETVLRNAPTLLNAVYSDRYFYDLRAFNLEQQVEHVIFNSKEFNTAYEAIINKLAADSVYPELFNKGFGKGDINRDKFSKALSSYVLSLQSFNSPFDKYIRGESDTIDSKIIDGFNVFMGKGACATCHFPPTFSGLAPPLYRKNETEILGILEDPDSEVKVLSSDKGRYVNNISNEKAWIYERSFKTSTVRNVLLTGPYFHNGAYKTLESVVDFYNEGGGEGMGLEVKNQTLSSSKLNLTDDEKEALILFMKSLSESYN